jgi:pimeloyl-ACP methyl ester carboxylesterase
MSCRSKEVAMLTNLRSWFWKCPTQSYTRRQPVVLINGLAEQPESWFRNVPFWRQHFDVYMPNLLVYDGTVLHQRIDAGLPVSVDFLVAQLHRYLESFVQAPPYHLIGSSLGGKIVVEYAARHVDQVARVVLLCPSGLGDEERLPIVAGVRRRDPRQIVESILHDRRNADAGLFEYYKRKFADRRWRCGLLHTVRGTTGYCVRQRLAQVPQPTLLISGSEDRIVNPQTARKAARLLPQGQFLMVPECGHAPQMEKPWFINRIVLSFLAGRGPRHRPRRRELWLAGPNAIH